MKFTWTTIEYTKTQYKKREPNIHIQCILPQRFLLDELLYCYFDVLSLVRQRSALVSSLILRLSLSFSSIAPPWKQQQQRKNPSRKRKQKKKNESITMSSMVFNNFFNFSFFLSLIVFSGYSERENITNECVSIELAELIRSQQKHSIMMILAFKQQFYLNKKKNTHTQSIHASY